MDYPWNDNERNDLLCEIIKTSRVLPPTALFSMIRQYNINPAWEDTVLPRNRTVGACKSEFERIRQKAEGQSYYGPGTPFLNPHPQLKRQHEPAAASVGGPRLLQPKPPGEGSSGIRSSEPPTKRRRGRPTKQEQEARQQERGAGPSQAAGASSAIVATQSVGPGATPAARTWATTSFGSPMPIEQTTAEQRPPAPPPASTPVSRMPISQIISTPTAPSESHQSSSSSGKRRRTRSSRSLEDMPVSASLTYEPYYGPPTSTQEQTIPGAQQRQAQPQGPEPPYQQGGAQSRPESPRRYDPRWE